MKEVAIGASSPSTPSVSTTDEETGSDDSSSSLDSASSESGHHQLQERGKSIHTSTDDNDTSSSLSRTTDDEVLYDNFLLHEHFDHHRYLDDVERKEEIHVLLANIERQHGGPQEKLKHDELLKSGAAQHLARCLKQLIQVRHREDFQGDGTNVQARTGLSPSRNNCSCSPGQAKLPRLLGDYRTRLEPTRALQVAATCRAMHLILRGCSTPALESQLFMEDEVLLGPSAFALDLMACLPVTIHLLAVGATAMDPASSTASEEDRGGSTVERCHSSSTSSSLVRFSGLSSCLGILQITGPFVWQLPNSSSDGTTLSHISMSFLMQTLLSLAGVATVCPTTTAYHDHRQSRQCEGNRLHMPPDLRVDAASALANLLSVAESAKYTNRGNKKHPGATRSVRYNEWKDGHHAWMMDPHVGNTLVSLLSTGALTVTDEDEKYEGIQSRCLAGLARLAQWDSGTLAGKLLRHRRVVSAICKHLMMPVVSKSDLAATTQGKMPLHRACSFFRYRNKHHAVNLTKVLIANASPPPFSHDSSDMKLSPLGLEVQDNTQRLASAAVNALLQETHTEIKISLMEALVLLIEKGWLKMIEANEPLNGSSSSQSVMSVLNVLFFFASSFSGVEDFVVQSATLYLQAVRVHESVQVLSTAVNLLASPFAKVREQVLQAIIDLCFWKVEEAKLLLRQSCLLDHLSCILSQGSKSDSTNAVKVSKQLVVFHQDTQSTFCGNAAFLASLVTMVTQEPVRNRSVYADAVDVLMELISAPDQMPLFLPYNVKLLPWLVKFANRTSDEELKKRAASAIVRYSSMLLTNF